VDFKLKFNGIKKWIIFYSELNFTSNKFWRLHRKKFCAS